MVSFWGRLSFSVVLIVLAAATLAGVAALRLAGAGVDSLAFLVVPLGAGGWYLFENREHPPLDLTPRPAPPAAPGPPAAVEAGGGSTEAASPPAPEPWEPMPSPDEPFDDPVELADQLDRERPPDAPEAPSPTPAESDAPTAPP